MLDARYFLTNLNAEAWASYIPSRSSHQIQIIGGCDAERNAMSKYFNARTGSFTNFIAVWKPGRIACDGRKGMFAPQQNGTARGDYNDGGLLRSAVHYLEILESHFEFCTTRHQVEAVLSIRRSLFLGKQFSVKLAVVVPSA